MVKKVKVMENVLKANDMYADQVRQTLKKHKIKMYNLIGSPGAGKTSVLESLLPLLIKAGKNIAVIEGDCSTSRDADRIAALDISVVQINTGNGCHLDANLIYKSLDEFDLESIDIIFIENVGNLVCPAAFDLGEDSKIAIISTTEGDDKPLKYPRIFNNSDMVILTKTDLIPYTNFNITSFKKFLSSIKTNYNLYPISNTSKENVEILAKLFI
ncbi:MAG: hydrogenase accessory protein HypB [Candidatus Margulisbacteria bacterium GWF2_35_9]|nr:MAG: hydrogenase accessory protein HypB [Candidatus Margulisbacteria bacterium GWF2_35_9]